MTFSDTIEILTLLAINYPRDERFQGDEKKLEVMANIWFSEFGKYSKEDITAATMSHMRKNKYAPELCEIWAELKNTKFNFSEMLASTQEQLVNAMIEQIDLEHDYGYTFMVGCKTQGQIAREKSRRLFDSLPEPVREFCGSFGGFRERCKQFECSDNSLTFIKNEYRDFLKDYCKAATPENLAELGELSKLYIEKGSKHRQLTN